MARFAAAYQTTTAATALLPMASIYSAATARPLIQEVGVFNTTAVACQVGLCRLTTAGTSSAFVGSYESDDSQAAITTPRNSHSSTGPTIAGGAFRLAQLGAAVGSGVIWTFEGAGLVIPTAVTNGIGVYTPNGTGQVCTVYWVWVE